MWTSYVSIFMSFIICTLLMTLRGNTVDVNAPENLREKYSVNLSVYLSQLSRYMYANALTPNTIVDPSIQPFVTGVSYQMSPCSGSCFTSYVDSTGKTVYVLVSPSTRLLPSAFLSETDGSHIVGITGGAGGKFLVTPNLGTLPYPTIPSSIIPGSVIVVMTDIS